MHLKKYFKEDENIRNIIYQEFIADTYDYLKVAGTEKIQLQENALKILSSNPVLLEQVYNDVKDIDLEEIDFDKESAKLEQGVRKCAEFQMELILSELREKINTIDYDIIICSPLIRAKHTAKIINVKEKEILIDNRLEERNPGSLSRQSLDVTNRDEYWNYYTEIQYGTSENIQEFFKRIYNFLDELKIKDYKNVLVVAHSGVSKAFDGYFEGIKNGLFLDRGLKNCEIKKYEF